jgi:hypothetical protein
MVHPALSALHIQDCTQSMAGMLMVSMCHTVPSAETLRPVYVVPPDTPSVFPKDLSAEAKVMVVFLYVCLATVPLH